VGLEGVDWAESRCAAMSLYVEQIYPRLVSGLRNPEPIRELRKHIVPLARGIVLEVGVGSGANLAHDDATRVRLLYALEPNTGMLRLAEMQRPRSDGPGSLGRECRRR
jgi:hypothetical protein